MLKKQTRKQRKEEIKQAILQVLKDSTSPEAIERTREIERKIHNIDPIDMLRQTTI